ncbi:MAG: hypothetical protein ACYTGN_06095 [Planctomycetota bacterium]|jgi:hypothetical protein
MEPAWDNLLPTLPGHYWVMLEGMGSPDIEHVELDDDGQLVVVDEDASGWLPLADVWGDTGALWFGPMIPPDPPPGVSFEEPTSRQT